MRSNPYFSTMKSEVGSLTSADQLESITVLLPVHNRGSLTANFIAHLSKLMPNGIDLKVVIFDDGCTDDTLINIKNVWPSVEVISLDGSAFWGGCINASINYIKSRPLSEASIYLLANDDIRFPSTSALMAGLQQVEPGVLICARGVLVDNLDDNSLAILRDTPHALSKGVHYNSKKGNFEEPTILKPVNVSATYAMLATKDAWLSASTIPLTIPHYLSDYWLTYKLVLNGYRIVHPDEFICFVSVHTTRNKLGIEHTSNWFKNKARYLQSGRSKTSTSYFPAWIEFLSQKPVHPIVGIKILKIKLHIIVSSILYRR